MRKQGIPTTTPKGAQILHGLVCKDERFIRRFRLTNYISHTDLFDAATYVDRRMVELSGYGFNDLRSGVTTLDALPPWIGWRTRDSSTSSMIPPTRSPA